MMMNCSIIENYLELNSHEGNTTILKRTRASTRKFADENKVEFKRIETRKNAKVAVYELNGRKHEIKIKQEATFEKITEVSCSFDCKGKLIQ
jgi:hypothetical protein